MAFVTTTENESSFLYRFLVSPQFRIARHVLLIAALSVIAFNLALTPYQNSITELGGWIYLIAFSMLLVYAFAAYFNLYYLLPKYLLTGRYVSYVVFLALAVLGALLAQLLQEYVVYSFWPQVKASQPFFTVIMLIDYISALMMTTLCMVGGSMTVLLKLWMVNNQRIAQLEKAHVLSEVEQLKEQVSPSLLFKILNRSGHLALADPVKASKMLMKLSQLLRYQLYDCSREKVLLGSEISFLTNYLTLEQLSSERFEYSFSSDGDVNCTFVPPLLFIPFVQYAVERMCEQDILFISVHIRLEADTDDIRFVCSCPGIDFFVGDERGLERIRQRLDLQYGRYYDLQLEKENIRLELRGGTLWRRK